MRIKNIACLLLVLSTTFYTNANDDRHRLRAKSPKDDKIFPFRGLLESGGPTCSTPCNFDTRCVGTNDGCPLCRRNRCVPIPSCNANCTFSEDCSGAADGCSVCNPKNNQCVQPFPKCNIDCTRDSECSDSTDNCAVCNIVRRVCVSSLPSTGSYCYSDDHCLGARDGSTICNIVKRQCVISIPHRGSGCSTDVDCLGATDGSSSCVNGMCASSKLFANNPKCNSQTCSSDCECSSATDGCITCVNGYCVSNRYNNIDSTSRCGLGCLSNSECSGAGSAITSCQICQNNICVSGMSNTSKGVECISTEQSLQNAFAGAAASLTVTLCMNSVITLTQELIVTIGVKVICERPNTCIMKGAGSYRLITFTEGNVQLDGIIFQSGDAAGNGGALLFMGSNNSIRDCSFTNNNSGGSGGAISFEGAINSLSNCTFIANRATFKGGAIYAAEGGSGSKIIGNVGSTNIAPQCADIYYESVGSCQSLLTF